ncbi:hypothetical protein C2E25_17170 [Geothermobacter hydrogeniphilus]|uniref:Uncharacterized protein n=1 Tax=Geothermobacter hydrogeniphilus TaxID=1969733 RepID=A0A2K2H5M0_9BACT|nr:hypothetical protein [Geothermobacter hydrogeniphilus]PNU18539.1 hypothetical protein C2E25_17170 [Geothermobacter hydrogeniphilus]
MKKTIFVIFLVIVLYAPAFSFANVDEVIWSGVGFSGNWADRNRLYPVTSSFFELDNKPLEVWARKLLLDGKSYPFAVKFGTVDISGLDPIALAITITGENVFHEAIIVSNKIKHLENYSISGAAIFFNLKTKKLVASVPLITRFSKVYETKPDENETKKIFKSVLSDDTLGVNFFSEMSKRLEHVKLNSLPSKYVQIGQFTIDDTVHESVARSPKKDLIASYLSTFFENRLMSESGLALIPNKVGYAIGNKVATRLPSGDMTIVLPEPGYTINFRVHKLLYQKKPNKATDCLCYGGVLSMTVISHLFGEEEFAKFGLKDVNCCNVDKGVGLDDVTEFQKLLMGILDGLAKQFKDIDKKWLKVRSFNYSQSKRSIEKISKEFMSTLQ